MLTSKRNTYRNTKVFHTDYLISVRLYGTEIVKVDSDGIRLSGGGWRSATTKKRLNEVSEAYNLGYEVYQEDFSWYVQHRGVTTPFEDGMILER